MTYSATEKDGYIFTLFKGDTDLLCVLLSEKEEAERVFNELPFPKPSVISVEGYDWNGDLSPWKARRAFRGKPDFGGGANKFTITLTELLPQTEKQFSLSPKRRFIAGYSLAGLFALYSLFRTDVFDGVVSASGSLWFDGFTDFMNEASLKGLPKAAYISLGDREKMTRDPRLAKVEDETLKAVSILREKGVDTFFEFNEGNHFDRPEKRLAKGIADLASRLS